MELLVCLDLGQFIKSQLSGSAACVSSAAVDRNIKFKVVEGFDNILTAVVNTILWTDKVGFMAVYRSRTRYIY